MQCFTPPLWITGHDRPGRVILSMDIISKGFYEVLEAKSNISRNYAQLMEQWSDGRVMFPIVQILRQPDTLLRVYYRFLFREFFEGDRMQTISEFLQQADRKEKLESEVQIRVKKSKRYTAYLHHHGLLIEEAEEDEEILARLKEGIAGLDAA